MTPLGALSHPFLCQNKWPGEVIKKLDSKVRAIGGSAYYSERYHSRRNDFLPLSQYLDPNPDPNRSEMLFDVAAKMDLTDLLDQNVMNLSNGQSKRAQIAKLLLEKPEVLIFDEPYVGLDPSARENLNNVMGTLASKSEPSIILALRPLDPVPSWITHILWLNQDGTVKMCGEAAKVVPKLQEDIDLRQARVRSAAVSSAASTDGASIVELKDVGVSYWGKCILSGINWHIREGQRWALSGNNGSGKTTLLSLIQGDHPKSYANDISVFGRKFGTGASVFDIQTRMGHTSPEIHKHFPLFRTGYECLSSAFSESFHPRRDLSAEQRTAIASIAEYFDVEDSLQVPLVDMTPALQRLHLLMRALVKQPSLLILDESFAGMDEHMIQKAKFYINNRLDPAQSLIFVTHHEDEIPETVTHTIRLDNGRVVECTKI